MSKLSRQLSWSLLLLLLASGSLFGCDLTKFVIKKGAHYSTQRVRLVGGDELKFGVLFDESAVYRTQDPQNQGDINKLYGFSDCASHHQTNSARFGWRWLNARLEILAYTYVDSQRQSKLLGVAQIGQTFEAGLRTEGQSYVFTFNGVETVMPRGCDGKGNPKYQLWPYFGGDETAPHEITIYIEEHD